MHLPIQKEVFKLDTLVPDISVFKQTNNFSVLIDKKYDSCRLVSRNVVSTLYWGRSGNPFVDSFDSILWFEISKTFRWISVMFAKCWLSVFFESFVIYLFLFPIFCLHVEKNRFQPSWYKFVHKVKSPVPHLVSLTEVLLVTPEPKRNSK